MAKKASSRRTADQDEQPDDGFSDDSGGEGYAGGNGPVRVYRVGYVTASVFAREVGDPPRVLHSVCLQKRYLDNGTARYTNSFGLAELPQAARVLQLAQSFIERQEAEVRGD